MSSRLVLCAKHGPSPAYVVCDHVRLEKAPVFYFDRATETYIGQAICEACHEKGNDVDINILHCICAGHVAEEGWMPCR